MTDSGIRIRFAPSPTGLFHIGLARTALFNWLLARHTRGTFILRIEDTDRQRSTARSTFSILGNMRWLGLDWDEGPEKGGDYGPYYQMERLPLYEKYAGELLARDCAYRCFCTSEELQKRRQEAASAGRAPGYDGRCRQLGDQDRETLARSGRKSILRFRTPRTGATGFHDQIRGDLVFANEVLDDFVIMKSDGTPTFLFANVVDDHLMAITDVVRGDDHVSNTPRQILLYGALGLKAPRFAHLAMILGADGKKLSKREGARSLSWHRRRGYLPEAMVNYLALLGWSTSDSQQVFSSTQEIVEKFSLERVGKNPAIFDPKKLEWMNGEHIRSMSLPRLRETATPFLKRARLLSGKEDSDWVERVLALEQERLRTLSQVAEYGDFFFLEEVRFDPAAVEKVLRGPNVPKVLALVRERLSRLEDFDLPGVEKTCRDLIAELGIKGGELTHPVRVAVTGKTAGPGLFELISVLGKERTLARLDRALAILLGAADTGSMNRAPTENS